MLNAQMRTRPARYVKPEKLENGVFTGKTRQVCLAHVTPVKFEKAKMTGYLEWCLRKTRVGNHVTIVTSSLYKSSVFFRPH